MSKPKMSTVLDEGDPLIQIKYRFNENWDNITKQADGYCALGLLACKSNNVDEDGCVPTVLDWLTENYDVTVKDFEKSRVCPLCDELTSKLEILITHWNDQHELSFQDIAAQLRKLKL